MQIPAQTGESGSGSGVAGRSADRGRGGSAVTITRKKPEPLGWVGTHARPHVHTLTNTHAHMYTPLRCAADTRPHAPALTHTRPQAAGPQQGPCGAAARPHLGPGGAQQAGGNGGEAKVAGRVCVHMCVRNTQGNRVDTVHAKAQAKKCVYVGGNRTCVGWHGGETNGQLGGTRLGLG